MTRLRMAERRVLDTLVEAGVARSRSHALAWCVRLVGEKQEEWLGDLREALKAGRTGPGRGPGRGLAGGRALQRHHGRHHEPGEHRDRPARSPSGTLSAPEPRRRGPAVLATRSSTSTCATPWIVEGTDLHDGRGPIAQHVRQATCGDARSRGAVR